MCLCVQFSSDAQSCLALCNPMACSMPGFPVHYQLPEFTQPQVHHFGDSIQPAHPLPALSPPAFNLSQHQGLFQWVSSSHQVAKVLEFSFSISPSNEYSGLISFRMDWLDLLAVQGTLKCLLHHHSSKASILWCFVSTIQINRDEKTEKASLKDFWAEGWMKWRSKSCRLIGKGIPRRESNHCKDIFLTWLRMDSVVIILGIPKVKGSLVGNEVGSTANLLRTPVLKSRRETSCDAGFPGKRKWWL